MTSPGGALETFFVEGLMHFLSKYTEVWAFGGEDKEVGAASSLPQLEDFRLDESSGSPSWLVASKNSSVLVLALRREKRM